MSGGYHDESEVLSPLQREGIAASAEKQRQRREARAQRVANEEIAKALKKGRGRKV